MNVVNLLTALASLRILERARQCSQRAFNEHHGDFSVAPLETPGWIGCTILDNHGEMKDLKLTTLPCS